MNIKLITGRNHFEKICILSNVDSLMDLNYLKIIYNMRSGYFRLLEGSSKSIDKQERMFEII